MCSPAGRGMKKNIIPQLSSIPTVLILEESMLVLETAALRTFSSQNNSERQRILKII